MNSNSTPLADAMAETPGYLITGWQTPTCTVSASNTEKGKCCLFDGALLQ